jgi:hypothetical protein
LVVVRTDGVEHRLQGRGSLPLFEGDVLRTEAASQALIQLRPGIPVALNERTTLKILSRWDKTAGTIRILRVSRGGVWAKAGDGARQLEIESPAAVAAARDAEIDVKVAEDGQSALTVVQGTAELGTPFGVCSVRGGTASVGARGTACTAPQPANVAAAVSWKQAVTQSAEDQIERDAEESQPDRDADEGAGLALDGRGAGSPAGDAHAGEKDQRDSRHQDDRVDQGCGVFHPDYPLGGAGFRLTRRRRGGRARRGNPDVPDGLDARAPLQLVGVEGALLLIG